MVNLYIDPGTGSMLFSVLIGIIGVVVFVLRTALIKIRFILSGGKKAKIDKNKLPIVIFADHKRYWNVFRPICEELERRGQKAWYYTASPDDPALDRDDFKNITCEFIGEGNKAFSRLNFLNAYILLTTTPGLDVYQWKRSKTVNCYVHTLHAPASIFYRMFGIDYFDTLLLSAEHQRKEIRQLEELRKLPEKDIRLTGLTYLDEMKKRFDSAPALEKKSDKPVVILAPSWGPSAILSKYGAPFIEELIKTGYHVVIRPHPQSFSSEADLLDKLMKQFPDSDDLEWNSDNDNFDVLRRADIMISDFSGVIFDFLLVFDKPILYANAGFSKDLYDWWWLEEEPWTFQVLPELGKEINDDYKGNLKAMIDECINDPKYEQARQKARAATWENIGNAASSVCDYLEEKLKELTSEESSNK